MAVALLVFTVSTWMSAFVFFVALVQRIEKPNMGSAEDELKRTFDTALAPDVGLIITILGITVIGSITIACKGWARKFLIITNLMFRNTLVIHFLTTAAVCIPEYAKYRSDPRESVIAMCVVIFGSSMVFLFRSAAQGGAGTAKVMSTAAFVSFMSSFTTPEFPVKGAKLIVNQVVLGLTSALGACYLYCSPEAPLVKLEVEAEAEAEAPEEDDNEGSLLNEEAGPRLFQHAGELELVPLRLH